MKHVHLFVKYTAKMSIQDKILLRKIKNREKKKLTLMKLKEAEKKEKRKYPIIIVGNVEIK